MRTCWWREKKGTDGRVSQFRLSCRRWANWFRSEDELQRELQLSRRSGVAGREACVADDAEGRAADGGDAARLTEIHFVEDVEDFGPELYAKILGD